MGRSINYVWKGENCSLIDHQLNQMSGHWLFHVEHVLERSTFWICPFSY